MPATTFMERSRASLGYARQTVGTASTAFRHRAASLNVCSFNCWVVHGEEPTRLSRSFTASAQSLSARRIDANGSGPSSPENTQQVQFSADGEDRIATPALKGLFVKNRDPLRDEEFHSLSSGGSSPDGKSLKRDSNPLYLSSNELWARNNGGSTSDVNALRAREEKEEMEEEEFPVRRNKKAKYAATDTRSRPQIKNGAPDEPTSTHKFDAASHLAWLLTRGSQANILTDTHEKTSSTSSQQRYRRRRRIPGEAERRKGRVFDEGTDYTQPPPSHHNATNQRIKAHLIGAQPEQRSALGLVPARKALPRPPPAGSVERIPVKVVRPSPKPPIQDARPAAKAVTETSGRLPRKLSPASKKAIRISMFHPIVGGLDHAPSPLQQLPRDIISTATITTPTTFPYLPPLQPSHPQYHTRKTMSNTNTATKANKINPSTNLILTDAEFPRRLGRDGPGSRFPFPLLDAPTTGPSRRRQVGRVPEVVLTSPTETSRSVRSASLARSRRVAPATPPPQFRAYSTNIGTRPSRPDGGRVYIPYSPAKREGVCCSEDIGSKAGRVGSWNNGKGVVDGGRRFVAYRPPPPPFPPAPARAPLPPPSATPVTTDNINTPTDDHGSDGDDDVLKEAVTMNLIYFQSQPPPSPSSSAPSSALPAPSSATTRIVSPTLPNTNIHTRKETTSPPPSILLNASSIRRMITARVIDFTTPISTAHKNNIRRRSSIRHHGGRDSAGDGAGAGNSADAGAGVDAVIINKAENDTKRTSKAKAEVEYKRLTLNTATWTSFASGF